VAGALARVVADLCALLPPYSGLMLASMSSTGPSSASRTEVARLGRSHAALAVSSIQRTAQRVLAYDLGHAQRLGSHGIAAQRRDVRVAPVAGQQPEHQRAQHVALVRGVAAAVLQRAARHPALEDTGGGQELREEHQLAVRSGRSTLVPAHVHAPAQRVHDLRLGRLLACHLARRQRLASCFTHRVSVPRPRNAAPVLAQRSIADGQLPDLGSVWPRCWSMSALT
jgi:hypothetical protein